MAGDDSAEKTEKPTPKKLRDARRRGEVSKSQDLALAIGLIAVMFATWQLIKIAPDRLAELTDAVLSTQQDNFGESIQNIGRDAVSILLLLSAIVLLPVAGIGILLEFLQTGPVFSAEKLKPKLSNLNPVEGFKRMFGASNAVELLKSIAHTALLFGIGYHIVTAGLADFLLTPYASPLATLEGILWGAVRLFGWTLLTFTLLAILDVAWQRHTFEKKMRMSLRDIRDEHKSSEGDPQLKGQRRRLAQEWSRDDSTDAASKASVLIVNPVHVAIAVLYNEKTSPVPTVIGRGLDEAALDMRDAAAAADVPVLRHETLARALLKDTVDGDLVPRELFGVIAEITLWAQRAQARIERERRGETLEEDGTALPVPGEDLTRYPHLP